MKCQGQSPALPRSAWAVLPALLQWGEKGGGVLWPGKKCLHL
jgi:hypothetical protein